MCVGGGADEVAYIISLNRRPKQQPQGSENPAFPKVQINLTLPGGETTYLFEYEYSYTVSELINYQPTKLFVPNDTTHPIEPWSRGHQQ